MYKIGTGKADFTAWEPEIGMMGWANKMNTTRGVAMPVHARAVFIEDGAGNRAVYALGEMCFVTQGVRQAVIDRLTGGHPELGLGENNVMLSGNHTHSAAGGFSHYVLYNLTICGYSETVFQAYVDGFVRAITAAARSARPGRIRFAAGEIPESEPVSFQRAPRSYNANPEVVPVSEYRSPSAVNRRMMLLRFEDEQGRLLAVLNWFAVHCTSIHMDHHVIHPDNKGVASAEMEARFAVSGAAAPDFVAMFAQGECGDVTPNRQPSRARGFVIGEYEDDFESARFNGLIQLRYADAVAQAAGAAKPLDDTIEAVIAYNDMSNVAVNPLYADGVAGRRTRPASVGISMLYGTDEGPGPLLPVRPITDAVNRIAGWVRPLAARLRGETDDTSSYHGNRLVLMETGRGAEGDVLEGLGAMNKPFPVPGFVDPLVGHFREITTNGGVGVAPWTPHILPLQMLILGRVAICSLPAEITTIAARRMRRSLARALAARGVDEVILAPYAGAYSGYITTAEEYEVQGYEGGSTHFGKWTLAGYQTRWDVLAERVVKRDPDRYRDIGPTPPRFSKAELAKRAYRSPYAARVHVGA